MSLVHDKNYFMISNPKIYDNLELREPQIISYSKIYDHFIVKNKKTHAILVLPTGVGKTGLMGLLPYHICKGKVLIITPQLTIRDTVVDSLNPDSPESFWLKRKIFSKVDELPVLVEYDATLNREILDAANIIVLNIHKLQSRLQSSPLNYLPNDYFDMIIIDEAHHSTANTWVETTEHFDTAKVIKLTGTPIRTDGVNLVGELVYKYKLSQAMAKGYVKSLRNREYIPEKLLLTIENDETKKYTVDELLDLGIRDEDWIRRSVAFSRECSMHVVEASVKLLEEKKKGTSVPHKIIAVACSIAHAEQIKNMYIEKGYKAEVIHSNKSREEQERIKNDVENNRLDVIINVAMLGEGYDHVYLSVAAIFRPFRSELPYEQFIGRVLRSIPKAEIQKPDDNIADIVSHRNLQLQNLWEKYKKEIQESEVIKHLQDIPDIDDGNVEFPGENTGESKGSKIITIGHASEDGQGKMSEDIYLDTELIKLQREESKKQAKEIKALQDILKVDYESALSIYNQTRTKDTAAIKRPDQYFKSRKRDINVEIREVIVPDLITKFNINQSAKDLERCRLFLPRQYSWIKKTVKDNGGLLATYLNTYLKNEIGKSRDLWTTSDYDNAFDKLQVVKEYVEKVLMDYMQK